MSQCEAASPEDVAELWRRRFGQPPPIIASPEMMLRILESAPPRIEPQARTWVEADRP
jgi:hypothetical protein